MSIIGNAISTYRKLKIDMIEKFSIESESVLDEAPFFDEGYIKVQIDRLKRKHEDILRELKIAIELDLKSEYEVQKRLKLKSVLDRLEIKMLYYALNSLNSLDLCRTLSNGKDIKIISLIEALECFKNGDEVQAEEYFREYFQQNSIESAFFLGNKIYGKLLIKAGDIENALIHLEHAVQLKIDDKELLDLLQDIYSRLNLETELMLAEEVYKILG